MTAPSNRRLGGEFASMAFLLFGVLALLFHGVWAPGHTLFSNDGPLGRLISDWHHLPERFTGCWSDLNGIGFSGGAAPPGISLGLQYLLQPVWFSKLYALTSLLILGMGAWCFFTQMRLCRMACLLGGLAAALNSCFFSVACWGVAAQAITAGLFLFALAALANTTGTLGWLRIMLGGFAVGLGVVEGADVGAILSVFVAIFLVYQAWIAYGTPSQKATRVATRLTIVVLCAGLIAAQAISSLVDTSIKGVAAKGTVYSDEDQKVVQTKDARWDWTTQWSLPVRETLGLAMPGIFGYRIDTPEGGAYWGDIGQDPTITRYLENGRQGPTPHGYMRYSGGGFYAGVFVVLVALWALTQSVRRAGPFSREQRQWLWFWLAVAGVSLPLAYGRFAPFYRFVYALPYFSNIRNPIKFIYLVSLAVIIIFTCGLDGLYRRYMVPAPAHWPGWPGLWARIGPAEKSWLRGGAVVWGLTLLAWIEYGSGRAALVDYLRSIQLEDSAEAIASFSIRQVGWFALYLALAIVLLAVIFGGGFSGARSRWGGAAIGLLLLADLGRANLPWIVCWDYQYKYASNPIIERLRDQPCEHRVTCLPGDVPANLPNLNAVYRFEWLQQQFPYYNIQTLDIVDMPRKPADYVAYVCGPQLSTNGSARLSYLQMWRLSNTKYVLGLADDLTSWNGAIGDTNESLQVVERFNLTSRIGPTNITDLENWTATADTNGVFALFNYTGALPRAKLYSNWFIEPNDQATITRLFKPDFDPWKTVLVSGGLPAGVSPSVRQSTGTVSIVHYAPRHVVLHSDAPAAAVLLLNDHYDASWKVLVDGQPRPLLRCNFIMQGVFLEAGAHTVEFRHQPPFGLLYVSLSSIGLGLVCLTLVLCGRPDVAAKPSTASALDQMSLPLSSSAQPKQTTRNPARR